jgi:spore maturation protein CgeB
MTAHLRALANDPDLRTNLVAKGLETIRARHTCAHRVDELLSILARIGAAPRLESVA